jgi:mono/diheme cytochrome c family protein
LVGFVALAILAGAAAAQEAPEPESGAELFFTHCGACHGKGGEGDGPAAAELEFVPPDLTRIAERAGGEFPADQVSRIIDGRDPVEGHGGPEMPIWGDGFRFEEDGFDAAAAEARIQRVVDHIETLQKEKQ